MADNNSSDIEKKFIQDDRATAAFELEEKLRDTKRNLGTGFLEVGRILKEIRDNNYYTELGYDSITEWFSSSDVSIAPAWAWHFISIYETFVLEHKIPVENLSNIDYTKLQDIVAVVRDDPDGVDDWLDKARNLRRIDLKRELQEFKVGQKTKQFADTIKTETKPDSKKTVEIPHSGITIDDWQKSIGSMADKSVDCIITTPPIIIDNRVKIRTFYNSLVSEMKRVLTDNGSVFIFTNMDNMFQIGDILMDYDFTIIRDIVWFKQHIAIKEDPFKLLRSHETIIWASRGNVNTYVNNITDVEKDVFEIGKKNILVARFVEIGTYPKQLVYDPFLTDDSTMDLINSLDRRFIGNKKDSPNTY